MAAARVERILMGRPEDADALRVKARLQIDAGDLDGALASIDRAVHRFALVGPGEIESAHRDCTHATEFEPDHALERGMLAFLGGRREEAARQWVDAVRRKVATAREMEPWIARARERRDARSR